MDEKLSPIVGENTETEKQTEFYYYIYIHTLRASEV